MKSMYAFVFFCLINKFFDCSSQKIVSNFTETYGEFLNFGVKKISKLDKIDRENYIIKSKVEVLGEVFKERIDEIKVKDKKLDLIFLLDASSSVGEVNFQNELKFVKKLLSDIIVDYNHSRVALVTFSSSDKIVKTIDEISYPKKENNKCLLLKNLSENIKFSGGGTNTVNAFNAAQAIFERARKESRKVLFLITDGFSNGGDPIPIAKKLKGNKVTIFTIGIKNGNYKELYQLSSSPGEYYSYLLDSFDQFESLARRALHVDLQTGDYIPLGTSTPCDFLCKEGNCCDRKAHCSCGTSTGHYSCICQPGYYGSGLVNDCLPCPAGSFGNGPNLCLPCPDTNHVTHPGSESCKCKMGFKSTDNGRCEVIKCSKLSSPKDGYFVKSKACAYVFNSACGVRCRVGYTLEGSSIRLCQSNATWSGQIPTCQVKTCQALESPLHGSIICKHYDLDKTYKSEAQLPVDTVCSFGCERGRTLVGSRQRTCLPLVHWDGLKTSCKQVKCNKLSKIQFGTIEPKSCTIGKQAFGKNCSFTCDEGFELVGPNEKYCTGVQGKWNSKTEPKCKDVTKPKLICPDNIRNNTLPGQNFGQAIWIIPNATDNSELNITIWTKPAIRNIGNFKFKIGTTNVTYFAQDIFKNTAKCHFLVEIYDNEKPTIEDCENPPPYLTIEKYGSDITWDEPNIYDNSQNVQVTKSHEFGFFKIGTTTVTYTARDLSNNVNFCTVNITVEESFCEPLPDPIYGRSECQSSKDGLKCIITCQEGYAVPITGQTETIDIDDGATQFICDNENPFWYSYDNQIFPECSVTEMPTEIAENVTIDLEAEDVNEICKNSSKLSKFGNDTQKEISSNLNDVCNDIVCDLDLIATCEDYQAGLEEKTNLIKREIMEEEEEEEDETTTKRSKKSKKLRKKTKIKINLHIAAKARQKGNRKKLQLLDEKISKFQTLNGANVTKIQTKNKKILCSPGYIRKKYRCVRCPPGTFHNATRNTCQSCKIGYYNDKHSQTECIQCPRNFSTRKLQVKSIKDCVEQCGPGSYARKRQIKPPKKHPNAVIQRVTLRPYCRTCPIGSYQPEYNKLQCIKCSNGYTTNNIGSTSKHDCIPTLQNTCTNSSTICNNGHCIILNEFYYSCECEKYYVGTHCETKVNSCSYSLCKNGGICMPSIDGSEFSCKCQQGFVGQTCESIEDKCTLTCLNNGTCLQDETGEFCLCPKGYHGDRCEFKIQYCLNNLCENGGQCIEDADTFKCICFHGYVGKRCTNLPCDFRPCPENTICENINTANPTKNNYRCICEEDYNGENCTEKIDPCSKNKCNNDAVCKALEKSYFCQCIPNFYGKYCENKAEERYVLTFTRAGVSDYVKLDGFKSNLSQLSTCLWIQTVDVRNYGTILSYATYKYDNTFTITDYGGLVFYLNAKKIYSDIKLNDGFWHYFCFTWNSDDGAYAIYLDGKISQQGIDFAKGEFLDGSGKMVIGQEQDVLGGKFSQSESFLGKITHFDVWDKVLSTKDIIGQMHDCQNEHFGSVYAWPELKIYVHGNVKVDNSSFCKECASQLKSLHNGFIEMVNNTLYYKCDKGFILNDNKYANGRHCNKAGVWEGQEDPYCKLIYCHYPGYLRHGRIFGRKYSYMNKLNYVCNIGYKMEGNDTRICGEKGEWEPKAPICLGLRCKAFPPPPNGKVSISSDYSDEYRDDLDSYDVGTTIEIVCNENAKLEGDSLVTCEINGEWDNEVPKCIVEKPQLACSLDHIPAAPKNGYITEESRSAVENASSNIIGYKCRNGYRLIGETTSTCILDGYWTQPNISCESIKCPKPSKVKNAKTVSTENNSYTVGNMVTYTCNDGYKLHGSASIRCGINEKWTRFSGKCIRITCGKPNISETTVIHGRSYLYGEKVKLVCKSGKEYTWLCESSGKWSGSKDDTC